MGRYTGPVCRLCRRATEKLFLKGEKCMSPKCAIEKRPSLPGMHKAGGRPRKISERGVQLLQKQKARRTYGLMEKQFKKLFVEAEKAPGITGDTLNVLLERRLDNVVLRLGFARSHPQARQIVRHGFLLLNGHRINIPSYLVKEGDAIVWKEGRKKTMLFQQATQDAASKGVPGWLTLDPATLDGRVSRLPTPEEVETKIDGKAIVAYYSR